MASDEEHTARLPPGYRLEEAGRGLIALRRADGSTVALFAFSAFGPTPDRIRNVAEEDLRSLRGGED